MKPSSYQDVILHSLNSYEKISAKIMAAGELYIKVYTNKSVECVITEFEHKFIVKELMQTIREPTLIKNDSENGIEFLITFF
ncbi:MAG: hypothetical protein JNM51_09330 [Bacteroidia bacterium]|nr:hypothetical protein [Bacteroidia bacterium]